MLLPSVWSDFSEGGSASSLWLKRDAVSSGMEFLFLLYHLFCPILALACSFQNSILSLALNLSLPSFSHTSLFFLSYTSYFVLSCIFWTWEINHYCPNLVCDPPKRSLQIKLLQCFHVLHCHGNKEKFREVPFVWGLHVKAEALFVCPCRTTIHQVLQYRHLNQINSGGFKCAKLRLESTSLWQVLGDDH